MLNVRLLQRGVTLVELMVAVAIIAIVLGVGVPSFATWVRNSQIRTATESIKNGLQLAQAEALRRNTSVRFQLTSSVDNTCALSTTAANWIVNRGDSASNDPSGSCGAAPSDTDAPYIVQSRSANEGGGNNVAVAASQSTVVFNGLGQAVNLAGGSAAINMSNPGGGDCAPSGPMNCLRITISPGGQIRMCDPNKPAGTPQGC